MSGRVIPNRRLLGASPSQAMVMQDPAIQWATLQLLVPRLPIRSWSQSTRTHKIKRVNQGVGTDELSGSSSDSKLSFEQKGSGREGSDDDGRTVIPDV